MFENGDFGSFEEINSFRGEYEFLSNFYPANIRWNGFEFDSVEHAYVFDKVTHGEDFSNIERSVIYTQISCKTAGGAKRFGKTPPAADWMQRKPKTMLSLVRQKFGKQLNPTLHDLLAATGDKQLTEGNTWGDTFWGMCNGNGLNVLGNILMKVRQENAERENKQQ